MANGRLNLGKQSGGVLSVSFPDGVNNTEVVLPESGELVNKEYADLKVALADFIGTNQSKVTNGYQKLPGGVIIQWGTDPGAGNDRNIYYPIAFPNVVLGVYATMVYEGIPLTEVQSVGTGNVLNLSMFSVYPRYQNVNGATGNAIQPLHWLAIGY